MAKPTHAPSRESDPGAGPPSNSGSIITHAVDLDRAESPVLSLIARDDLLVARMVDSLEKIVEGRLTSAARIHDPIQRAKVAQGLLPSAVTLKNEMGMSS